MQPFKNGFTVWQGPSEFDGRPIALIVAGLRTAKAHNKSGANRKTGAMVQTYILATDESPVAAKKSGLDAAICGDCVHRVKGSCYVRTENGPLVVWKGYQSGRYPKATLEQGRALIAGLPVRLGAYGDPCAIPFEVWKGLLAGTTELTGYTHAWKVPRYSPFKQFCMASTDTLAEHAQALSEGWRSFLVVPKGDKGPKGAMLCPASEEAGKKLTCEQCLACGGQSSRHKASVYIPVHGVSFKQKRFSQTLIQIERGNS